MMKCTQCLGVPPPSLAPAGAANQVFGKVAQFAVGATEVTFDPIAG